MKDNLRPFHLAIPVSDFEATQDFYTNVLGCSVGRTDKTWMDFNFFGHQVVAHLVPGSEQSSITNHVDGEDVPYRHFGIIMRMPAWENLVRRIREKKVKFLISPQIRFKGKLGE